MKSQGKLLTVFALIFAAAASRLMPHPPNVTPITAMCLFGGALLGFRLISVIVSFASLYLSDLLLNNTVLSIYYPESTGIIWWADYMYWTYAGFAAIVLIGSLLKRNPSIGKMILVSLLATGVFYALTSFGTWASGIIYPVTGEGLIASFTAGIPFLRNSMMGNVAFTLIIFSAYKWITSNYRSSNPAYQKTHD